MNKVKVRVVPRDTVHFTSRWNTIGRAHWRYYDLLGFVVGGTENTLAVVVYGEIPLRSSKGMAFVRRQRPQPLWSDHRNAWTPERLKKRIKQHRNAKSQALND